MLVNKGGHPMTTQPKRQMWVVFVGEECVGVGVVMGEPLPLAPGGTCSRRISAHPLPELCIPQAIGAGQAVCSWLGWLSLLGTMASVPAGSSGTLPTTGAPVPPLPSWHPAPWSSLSVCWGKFSSFFWSGSWLPYCNCLHMENLTWGGSLAKASPL